MELGKIALLTWAGILIIPATSRMSILGTTLARVISSVAKETIVSSPATDMELIAHYASLNTDFSR